MIGGARTLYAIEKALPPPLPPGDGPEYERQRLQRGEQRQKKRQAEAGPVLEKLERWLAEQRDGAPPKTPLGRAITYARNNWGALKRYLEKGFLGVDNNLCERTLRAIALGRNNWGVIGSEAGGKTAAVLYSVVGTCKHLNIDPFAYLRETLMGVFALGEKPTGEQLTPWLPGRWLLARQAATAAPAS